MTKTIEQEIVIHATPSKVFEALIDQKKHARFTGEPAKISRRVGGAFTCYGGYIKGITLELVPAKRIVQAWRSRNWPKGVYCIVRFELSKSSGGRTKLRFSQIGVPADDYKEKNAGWKSHYWKPLKGILAKR
jgi:uncharacterized protein YndB with AHSA1/START domain